MEQLLCVTAGNNELNKRLQSGDVTRTADSNSFFVSTVIKSFLIHMHVHRVCSAAVSMLS